MICQETIYKTNNLVVCEFRDYGDLKKSSTVRLWRAALHFTGVAADMLLLPEQVFWMNIFEKLQSSVVTFQRNGIIYTIPV